MDPELEAFVPLFPPADLTDPVTARRHLAELAGAAPAPDTTELEIEDSTVPAEPDVPVRIFARSTPRAPSCGCTAAVLSWGTSRPSTRGPPGLQTAPTRW